MKKKLDFESFKEGYKAAMEEFSEHHFTENGKDFFMYYQRVLNEKENYDPILEHKMSIREMLKSLAIEKDSKTNE